MTNAKAGDADARGRRGWCWSVLGLLLVCTALPADEPPARLNVVLLVSDDLNVRLGCYGDPVAQTPHLDALARRSVLFDRAYCQFPHCNPSRSSFLTGQRPWVTRVTNNVDNLYENLPGVMTLPRWFRTHGYATARCGKVFHLGVPSGLESMDDPDAWDFGTPFRDERPYPPQRRSVVRVETGNRQGIGWRETLSGDDELVDGNFARTAIEWLKGRDGSQPFFLAVGFHRPHLPLVAPAKYFDRYPFADIRLPDEPADDEVDIPLPARNGAVPGYALSASPEQRRAAIRGYLAATSYMDAQAGRVLESLDQLGLANKTIVVFASDHGWHLGEHGLWHKRSLFEESARVPVLVHLPGAKGNGQRSQSLIELLDIFPTLCDLAGLPAPPQLQGQSLRPLLENPAIELHSEVFTEARRGKDAEFWGRSVRTARWRYTEWNAGEAGQELYDHDADPHEFHNLARDPQLSDVVADLRRRLVGTTMRPGGGRDSESPNRVP
ncbi:MAG: sulfatase [Pirellulaceae bacterium]